MVKRKYKVSDEKFIEIIKNATSIQDALKKQGLYNKGRNYDVLARRCKRLGIKPPKKKNTVAGFAAKKRKEIYDCDLMFVIAMSQSAHKTLLSFGLKQTGANYRWLTKKIKNLNIYTSHWLGQGHLKGKTHNWSKKIPLEDILVKDSFYTNTNTLKKRLIKENYFIYQCEKCGINQWNGKYISLHLDHINGIHTDNRLKNLRFLCPNCHSQTPTYCGKNIGKYNNNQQPTGITAASTETKEKPPQCIKCGAKVSKKKIKLCRICSRKQSEKINWPEDQELLLMLKNSNFLKLGKKLGVSDNAIRKRLKYRGLL